MGQQEVIQYLNKHCKDPKTAQTGGEISRGMGETPQKISKILGKLMKHNEIKYLELPRTKANVRCGAFRRVNLYYI